ncbi:MAG: N-acetyl-gamma-glutamyl-phosphate reductase [Clostridiales bacterium]|jgi:N-acetyl-gamma-glutamyl-phosphate reductase|nr:N-acetyl-gamma-glutamyl-phosphate reductase [Clostridiales bacterium]
MVKVGIIGANGYTGFELLRLLAGHAGVKVAYAASRSEADKDVCGLYPALAPHYGSLKFSAPSVAAAVESKCGLVFTALPHGAGAAMCKELVSAGIRVVDLSADFRYNDIGLYEKTYNVVHPARELNAEAVYGLCEINRAKIKSARLVANPGCYTTASILPLLPLIKEGLVGRGGIIIDAKSGVTGAGRRSEIPYSFCETDGNFKAYSVTVHRHTSEIEEQLGVTLSFTPHLLPVKRGILATIYADCSADGDAVAAAYKKYYGGERFVSVAGDSLPELKDVNYGNVCRIGYKLDKRLNRIIIVSCLDNLIKGASGQAVQNMNVMLGFDEGEGLPVCAAHL